MLTIAVMASRADPTELIFIQQAEFNPTLGVFENDYIYSLDHSSPDIADLYPSNWNIRFFSTDPSNAYHFGDNRATKKAALAYKIGLSTD